MKSAGLRHFEVITVDVENKGKCCQVIDGIQAVGFVTASISICNLTERVLVNLPETTLHTIVCLFQKLANLSIDINLPVKPHQMSKSHNIMSLKLNGRIGCFSVRTMY